MLALGLAAFGNTSARSAQAAQPPTAPLVNHPEPAWAHGIVLHGEERDEVKSKPVTERPYRPLHFYGNTVRRVYYRGTPIPAPRDLVGAGAATILRK